jgi:hypothetical protein
MKNTTEIKMLISKNKGLTALRQSYQNEPAVITEEMKRVLDE